MQIEQQKAALLSKFLQINTPGASSRAKRMRDHWSRLYILIY
jgi:hypothetical protein